MQKDGRVLYGDARLSGDRDDNHEGNLGVGYRQLVNSDVIAGGHAWFDRRVTERSSRFNQVTLGAEALGRDMDIRANAYIPLSGANRVTIPNTGRTSPYLSGTGVLYDTDGTILEKPQGGFDIELGYRVPVFEEHADSTRLYIAGYRFAAKDTETVQGGRVRLAADVTPWLQLGGRYQYDKARGSQGFVEATFRLPGKSSFKDEGLRSRLDESPERDIDIVTSSKVTDPGIGKPVLNPETGQAQRILHVDNTAAANGDGSVDHPYQALKTAEAAMLPYDVVYVHKGDGTTTWQDRGIVIDRPGVKLIGSGVDLVIEDGRIGGKTHGTPDPATIIQSATAAPFITNTTPYNGVDPRTGAGVFLNADDTLAAGITVNGAARDGIFAMAQAGQDITRMTVHDVTTTSNGRNGVRFEANGVDARLEYAEAYNVTSRLNTAHGLQSAAGSFGYIGNTNFYDSVTSNNTQMGTLLQTFSSGIIDQAKITNITASSNTTMQGIRVWAQSSGRINNAEVSNSTVNSNGSVGIYLRADGNGIIDSAYVHDSVATNNTTHGIQVQAITGGAINLASIARAVSTGNQQTGLYVQAQNNSNIAVKAEKVTSTLNSQNGIYADDDTTGTYTFDFGGGTLGSIGYNRVFSNTGTEARVDLDGGQLKAENNWWGVNTGLAGGETTLEVGSTIDAVPFLTSNPGL